MVLHKTKWFTRQVEKHGSAAYMVLYAAIGFLVLVGLEAGYILYWKSSMANFVSLFVALLLYYLMTYGSFVMAGWAGIESHAKFGKWYFSWALVIMVIVMFHVVVPAIVEHLPRNIDRHFDTLESARQDISDQRDWF